MNDIGIAKKPQRHIIKKMIHITITATHYIFCCRNRNWDSPDLMQFEIGRPRSGSPICFCFCPICFCYQLIITLTKFVIYKALFLNQNKRNSNFFASSEKKPFKRTRDGVYCPITQA